MAVEGVNSSNTNSNYALVGGSIGLATGAIAGGTMGYLSKPWFKEGDVTDTFVRQYDDNLIKHIKDNSKKMFDEIKKVSESGSLEGISDKTKLAIKPFLTCENPTSEELKYLTKKITEYMKLESFDKYLETMNDTIDSMSLKSITEDAKNWAAIDVKDDMSAEELKKLIEKHKEFLDIESVDALNITEETKAQYIADIKQNQLLSATAAETMKNEKKAIITEHINLENGSLKKLADNADENAKNIYKIIKKSIRDINTKAALKYGAIAAGVLGIVGAISGYFQSKKLNG